MPVSGACPSVASWPGLSVRGSTRGQTPAGEKIRFVYRHFPLVEVHPNAELAAEAAEAAAAQGKFWEMHHLLFRTPHHLALADLTKHAEAIGLDMTRFHAEMADHIYTQRIQEHRRDGKLTHLRATPAFFLNGKLVDMSFGLDKLEEAVHALTGAMCRVWRLSRRARVGCT